MKSRLFDFKKMKTLRFQEDETAALRFFQKDEAVQFGSSLQFQEDEIVQFGSSLRFQEDEATTFDPKKMKCAIWISFQSILRR